MNYMLIDITELEQTRVILIAPLREMALHGRLAKVVSGRNVIGPPVEGRGFAKLTKEQLQYLYWNTCEETPPDDYATLIQNCLEVIKKLPLDTTPLKELTATVAKLCPDEEVAYNEEGVVQPKVKKMRAVKDTGETKGAPSAMTTTGQVWTIAYELMLKCPKGVMPERKEIIDACIEEGINPATASTQYAKWKRYVLENVAQR